MSVENLSGQTLGQYELRDLLGAGGMGAVYRGYQRSLKREVAIKVLPSSFAEQPRSLERFNREAEISGSLQHPHIVAVYDFGTQHDVSYIVMPLLNGGSLAQRLQQTLDDGRARPALSEVVHLLRQLASALDYAHSRGVIHRDIKPGNIMFDNQGSAFLVDFGIAKLLDSTNSNSGTGAIGTAYYMPPEQWQGKGLTPAADQYALAVAVYATLAGHVPFDATTPYELMNKHFNEEPTPIRTWRSDLPPAVDTVLRRALSKDPAQRFPTVTAFAQAFESAVAGTPAEDTGFFLFPIRQQVRISRTGSRSVSVAPRKPTYQNPAVWAVTLILLMLIAVLIVAMQEITTAREGIAGLTQVAAAGLPGTAETASETPLSPSETPPPTDMPPPIIEMVTPTQTTTQTPLPTATVTETATATPVDTNVPTSTAASTVTPTMTSTATSTATTTETPSATPTLTAMDTATDAPSATLIPTDIITPSPEQIARTPQPSNAAWQPHVTVREFHGVPMVLVPAGCFMMGSTTGDEDERPVHQQCFDEPFWIDRYEVTNPRFGSQGFFSGSNRPRDGVRWNEAFAHCESRGARLPSEAEWEYAARGPDGLTYPWGNTFVADNVVYSENSRNRTADVGSRPGGVSWVGALDLSGNVWEWTRSQYAAYPYGSEDGRENISTDTGWVLRGGSWFSDQQFMRAAFRGSFRPSERGHIVGVRCVRASEIPTLTAANPTETATAPPIPTPTPSETPSLAPSDPPAPTSTTTDMATDAPPLTENLTIREMAIATRDWFASQTATFWTSTPTPDIGATVAAELTAIYHEEASQTATYWTASPIPLSPTPSAPPSSTATSTSTATPPPTITQTPTVTWTPHPATVSEVESNAEWEDSIHVHESEDMVLVPPGCFSMGERGEGGRQCFSDPFWIDRTEVSNAAFGSAGRFSADDQPREGVTWFEAQAFCEARGARLPTEAEWEYAARGPDALPYPWGDTFVPDYVLFSGTYHGDGTHAIDDANAMEGTSWVGSLHMIGNVREWVSSDNRAYPYNMDDGREDTPENDELRVVRGGSWGDAFTQGRISPTYRASTPAGRADDYTGFRCARTFTQADAAYLAREYDLATQLAVIALTETASAMPTATYTPTETLTPTVTLTPTETLTPSITPTPRANEIEAGTHNGTLRSGARDSYLYRGIAGELITIRLTADFDTYLRLFDPSGSEIAQNDDASGTTNSVISAFELPEDGDYTIAAGAYQDSGSGSYTLIVNSLEDCGDSRPPRLTAGLQGRVTHDDPQRVRFEPNIESRRVGNIPSGDRFAVIEGPECAGGYVWWRVMSPTGVIGWTAEADSERYYVEPHDTIADLNLERVSTSLQAAYQPFEHGYMIVFFNSPVVYVLAEDGYGQGRWYTYVGTFRDGDMEFDPDIVPPAGRFQPIRGFGETWRENPDYRAMLGWATAGEVGYTTTFTFQPGGQISGGRYVYSEGYREMADPNRRTFRLYDDGTWTD